MRFFPPGRLAAASDAVAILAFVLIGLSHHGGVSGRGFLRDALPLLGGWLAAGLLLRLYTAPTRRRLLATWLAGITAGVVVRAAILGHTQVEKEAAFLGVALGVTLAFALTARWLAVTASARLR